MSASRSITILGSTGSIGQNTLDVVSRHRDDYRIVALTANTAVDTLEKQCLQWQPEYAVMGDNDSAQQLADKLKFTIWLRRCLPVLRAYRQFPAWSRLIPSSPVSSVQQAFYPP